VPWLLPGVPPTGRRVEVLAISVVSAEHRSRLGRTTTLIARHRTLWDYAGLLAQLRLDPAEVAALLGRPA
jgi:carboxymethylenebutenolidase